MSLDVEYLEWTVGGYKLRASGTRPNAVEVRVVNALGEWRVLVVRSALTDQPTAEWNSEWWPGEAGADLRHSIERRVTRAIRAHHGMECTG